MSGNEGVRERVLAWLLPRVPATEAQWAALDRAVAAQAEYEAAGGAMAVPAGVTAFSIGDFLATLAGGGREYLCPLAWSILRNAGLIAYELPTARRV